MRSPRPPAALEWLVRLLSSDASEGLVGDITEDFQRRLEQAGARSARRAYRREVAASLPALLTLRWWRPIRAGLGAAVLGSTVAFCFLIVAVGIAPWERVLRYVTPAVGWVALVFGGGILGGVAAARFRPSAASSSSRLIGLFLAILVLMGGDPRLSVGDEVVTSVLAFAAAAIGAALAGRAVRREHAV